MTFSDYQRLRFERRDHGVLLITMDRPDRYNAADEQMHGDLARVWTEVSAYEMLSFMGPDVVEGTAARTEKRVPRFPSAQRPLFGSLVKTRASARGRPRCARTPRHATVCTRPQKQRRSRAP